MIVGNKEDEEKALAEAKNETIHLPVTQEEVVCMLKGIIFVLQRMNKNNGTLASLPYIKGLKFLNNDKKSAAIQEAARITEFFFVKFFSQLDTINQLFFEKIKELLQQMIANGIHQVVIPRKFMVKRKMEVKSFIGFIKSKMVPSISLPLKIQTAIDKREQRQSVQL